MERRSFNPSQELRLGACKKDNLMYRLKDDPNTLSSKSGREGSHALVDPEEMTAMSKERFGYAFVKETIIFFLFLGLFVFAAIMAVPEWSYESVALIKEILVTPYERGTEQVIDASTFFQWVKETCIPAMFKSSDVTGEPLSAYRGLFVSGNNRLMGPVRMRQVRIKNNCDVPDIGVSLDIGECVRELASVSSNEEVMPFGVEYLVNEKPGYTKHEIESLIAQGYAANVSTANTRWNHSSVAELCSEEPNPERDIGSTVDPMARALRGSNKGLKWYCEVGMKSMGKLGISYPNSGYVLDLPPVKWFKAWNKYQNEKLLLTREWNERFGPKVEVQPPSRTVTEEITPTLSPSLTAGFTDNGTETLPIEGNRTATKEVPTETTPVVPTLTPVDTSLDLPQVPSKQQYSLDAVQELIDHKWLDNQTAMVAIEFTLYNANTNMLTACRFIFEFLPTGQVVPYHSLKPLLLPDLESFRGVVVFLSELLLVMFILYYAVKEVVKARAFFATNWRHCQVCVLKKIKAEHLGETIVCPNCQRPYNPFQMPCCPDCYYDLESSHKCWKGYFSLWNLIDLSNIIIFFVVFGLRFKLRGDVDKIQLRTETQFIQFYPLAWQFGIVNCLNSANVMLSFFKTIKYLGKVRALSVLVKTLIIALSPVFWFLIFFGLVYMGFAITFLLAFGKDAGQYRNIGSSYMSLFVMILGDFDYGAIETSNYILAPLFFLVYNVLIVLVMSNIFISILDECYGEASELVRKGRVDYLNSSLRIIINKLKRRWDTFRGRSNLLLEKAMTLIKNIYIVKQLTMQQKDDLRAFSKTLNEDNDEEMVLEILRVFHGDVTRIMRYDDYQMLRVTVSDVKKKRSQREQRGRSLVFVDKGDEETVDLATLREEAVSRRQTRKKSRKESILAAVQLKGLEQNFESISAKMDLVKKLCGTSVDGWVDPLSRKKSFSSQKSFSSKTSSNPPAHT